MVFVPGTWNTGFTYHLDIVTAYSNTGNPAGVVYHYQNSTNYYALKFAALGGGASIFKVVNGVPTTVTTGSDFKVPEGQGNWNGVHHA